MDKSIEFIDFVFDRYAYLGLQPSVSKEDIKDAITKRRAETILIVLLIWAMI